MFPRELIERGVIVTSARGAIARTVAEFALASMLTLLRRMVELTRPGGPRPVSETLFDKTVALVGLGCVGRSLLDLLRPFGCKVLVVDPFLAEPEAERLDVEQVSLPEALGRATVVSLHAPDVPETRGMIGAAELAAMPDGAVLVNTARGRLIDTRALTACASTGRLRVALDVTDPEPLPLDHPLRLMANVIVTPHVAGPTTDDLPRLGEAAVAEVGRVLRGEPPMHAITATDYDRMSF
jgi:phosphoglycerate dehydrogenase-like enzyme